MRRIRRGIIRMRRRRRGEDRDTVYNSPGTDYFLG